MGNEQKRVPTVLERVERLEGIVQSLAQIIDDNNKKHREAVGSLIEVISAVIKCSGEGFDKKVEEFVLAARKERLEKEVEQAKKSLDELVTQGVLVTAETAEPGTVVVGREFDKDNNLLGVGRAQVEFERFVPAAQEKMKGQGVGFVYEGPDGKFEITEIYKYAPKTEPVPEPVPAQQ